MKTNKIVNWSYGLIMLLPFLMCIFNVLVYAFSRQTFSTPLSFSNDTFGVFFESLFVDNVLFAWVQEAPFYVPITNFMNIIVSDGSLSDFLCGYFTYGLTISMFFLGYEVLLAFIQIARKLVYSFVDKEW